ncbi:MAG: CDP-alcohol phosphatidyltransferase family protein [Acidimicrobiia bacterium]|nr:CDP-alcohol phosphatidyltransferase family protein [Acidimicrobiia bacterium]MDH5238144.1 CDP-alcohol phosphatidyltransferase family protein [Acidimicrobiia bacterium]
MGAALHHTSHFVTNAANMLTLARIAASPVLFWLVLENEATSGASWGAVLLGTIMAATDTFDGRLARRSGVTRSGAFLDPLADKVVVIGASWCLVEVGGYWWLPVTLITVREVGISLWRSYWLRRGLAVPARRSAKYKTLVQGIALLIAVLPPLEDHRWVIATALWLAVVFTLVSGLQYLRDGRAATSTTGA